HNDVGLEFVGDRQGAVAVGDIELTVARGQNVVIGKCQLEVLPELARRASDEHPHHGPLQATSSTTGDTPRSGSHQPRLSAYQRTVSAIPCSKGTAGAHPSSRWIFDQSSM